MDQTVASTTTVERPETTGSFLQPFGVENWPTDVCSIATLPQTAEPITTCSTSLLPGEAEGQTEYAESEIPEEKPYQNSASGASWVERFGTATACTVGFFTVLWGHSRFFKDPARDIRDAQEAKEAQEEEERQTATDDLSRAGTKEGVAGSEVD